MAVQASPTPRWGTEVVDPRGFNLPALKVRYLLDHLPNAGNVLEVGSGGGKILRTLAAQRPGLRVHGCDIADWTPPSPEIEFRLMTRDIPYDAGSFDAVLIFDVLEHVDDPEHLLAEVARVLRPGGRLVAFVPIEGERRSLYTLYRSLLGEDLYVRTKHHVQAFTHDGLARMVERRFVFADRCYAYHALGHAMDATFFAAAHLPRLTTFWWRENKYYAEDDTKESPFVYALNRLLELGNAVAYFESRLFSKVRFGVAGVLFEATPRPADLARTP